MYTNAAVPFLHATAGTMCCKVMALDQTSEAPEDSPIASNAKRVCSVTTHSLASINAFSAPLGTETRSKHHEKASELSSLDAILARHRRFATGRQDRDVPFSWISGLLFLFSYALLLTDVFRTNIAIRHLGYTQVEPNVVMTFGPYGYPVVHIPWNATSDEAAKVWSYKFDTTSVSFRALAEYFGLSSWPQCMFYKTQCDGERVAFPTVFRMLDSLVESVSQRKGTRRTRERPSVTLRTKNAYFDRVHEYIFPFFFRQDRVRTVSALYYDNATVSSGQFLFCAPGLSQLYSCGDMWINFESTCATQNAPCVANRVMWSDITANTQTLKAMYAGLALDMVLIESYDDRGRESVSFQGRQLFDVAVVTRVRDCTISNGSVAADCTTVAVDDHRYEGGAITTNVTSYFHCIASIRACAQGYVWLRLGLLLLGCYKARSAEPELMQGCRTARVRASLRTILTVPSQVVGYGSVAPVFAYAVAHLMDSTMVYESVYEEFTSLIGLLHIDIRLFVRVGAISMRSLWVLGSALHVFAFLRTRGCSSPTTKSVPGIPEFTLCAAAFLTITAQFRSLSFRNTDVISILEVTPSARVRNIRAARYDSTKHLAYLLCLGDTLDAKMLAAAFIAVTMFSILVYGMVWILHKLRIVNSYELTLWPHTIVSYAAGTLWPLNALMVSWYGFVVTPVGAKRSLEINPSADCKQKKNSIYMADASRLGRLRPTALIETRSEESRVIQNAIACLDGRSSAVNSTIWLMNLVVMSDPIVLLRLYWFGGHEIGIYRSMRLQDQLYLLPMALEQSQQNCQIDVSQMELLGVVNSMELRWLDLLQCG